LNKTLKIIGFGFQDDDFEADVLQVGKVKGISNEVGAIQILRHTFRGLFRPPDMRFKYFLRAEKSTLSF